MFDVLTKSSCKAKDFALTTVTSEAFTDGSGTERGATKLAKVDVLDQNDTFSITNIERYDEDMIHLNP